MTQYVDKSGMSAALSKINSYIKDKLDAANKGDITSAGININSYDLAWEMTNTLAVSANQTTTGTQAFSTGICDYYLIAFIIGDRKSSGFSDPFDVSHTISSLNVVKCPDTTTGGTIGNQYGTFGGSLTKDTSTNTISWDMSYRVTAPSQDIKVKFMVFGINVTVIAA